MIPYFGYDNIVKPWIEVELALLETLWELGEISDEDYALLTPEIKEKIMSEIEALDILADCFLNRYQVRAVLRGTCLSGCLFRIL